ncbi:MAG: SDR family oxidoreductase [Alphaproteobacteria bacterium]
MSDDQPILGAGAVALVSGASRGIGEAMVHALAARGARVIATARKRERLDKLVERYGKDILPLALDVTDAGAVSTLVAALPADWRAVDILINNAGSDVGGRRRFEEGAIEDWAGTIETNVTGLMRVTRAILSGMLARGRGHIVNLGSIAGLRPTAGIAAYNTSKAAVHMFSDALRAELKGTAIRVSEIMPGTARTGFAEARWRGDEAAAEHFYGSFETLLTADDVARSVVFALEQPPHVVIAQLLVLPTSQA